MASFSDLVDWPRLETEIRVFNSNHFQIESYDHGLEVAARHCERMGLKLAAREIRDLKSEKSNGQDEKA